MAYIVDIKKTGAHMKKLFKERNITVNDIRNELGLKSKQSVYRWYYGEAMPTIDHLYTIARMLKVPVDELLVMTTDSLSDERVMEIINWCNKKLKESDKLRFAYLETLGVVILPLESDVSDSNL